MVARLEGEGVRGREKREREWVGKLEKSEREEEVGWIVKEREREREKERERFIYTYVYIYKYVYLFIFVIIY